MCVLEKERDTHTQRERAPQHRCLVFKWLLRYEAEKKDGGKRVCVYVCICLCVCVCRLGANPLSPSFYSFILASLLQCTITQGESPFSPRGGGDGGGGGKVTGTREHCVGIAYRHVRAHPQT